MCVKPNGMATQRLSFNVVVEHIIFKLFRCLLNRSNERKGRNENKMHTHIPKI